MTVTTKIIADSISPEGIRLTSVQARFPRFILPELTRHRTFSFSVSSSRAIPVSKMIADVETDPVIPVHFGKNQPGMQAREELAGGELALAKFQWHLAAANAVKQARQLMNTGVHKQITSRVLEPFAHSNALITGTSWQNFFDLRIHEDAQPEIKVLAEAIKAAMDASTPEVLKPGAWHLPYVTLTECEGLHGYQICMISAARCARVSYNLHSGNKSTLDKDLELAHKLLESRHYSPFEHQATPDTLAESFCCGAFGDDPVSMNWANKSRHRNFTGYCQSRSIIGG